MAEFFTILILLVILLVVYLGYQYNQAQAKAQAIEEAQGNITAVVKKRLDLINKLIDVVGSYVNHEKLTHLAVVEGESMAVLTQARVQADSTLTQLNSIARNYPDLKANTSYNRIMDSLSEVEAEIQNRRERYNGVVRDYNTFRGNIPFLFFAPYLGFHKAPVFDAATADSLGSIQQFSADDGSVLREKFAGAGAQLLQGTKVLGKTVEDQGRALMERGQAEFRKRQNSGLNSLGTEDVSSDEDKAV